MLYPLITPKTHFDGVILADGDFPTASIPVALLRSTRPLIACDNAGAMLIQHTGIMPDAIIGDGDSFPANLKEQYQGICHFESEQEYNDLTKATRYYAAHYKPSCQNKTPLLCYVGATGKREDHTLGNISLPRFYRHHFGIDAALVTDYGWFVYCEGKNTFASIKNQQVSIFNLNCKRLQNEGLTWESYPFEEWWQGTVNNAESDKFTLDGDGEYIVFRTFKAKE